MRIGQFGVVWVLAVCSALLGTLPAVATDDLSIKGDRPGLGLEQFKAKYSRSVQGDSRSAPFCSDDVPGKSISTLLGEDWHAAAGVVTCSTHYPFEKHKGVSPTLAGQDADLFIYHFANKKLYKVTVLFSHSGFSSVRSAFVAKYGEPNAKVTETLQNRMGATFQSENFVWEDGVSSLKLFERLGSVERSALFLVDPFVEASVNSKGPGPRTDDI